MKIAGITRIRNEAAIIKNTLDHAGQFVDEIYVYDDASTDETVRICHRHPKVKKVIRGKAWDPSPQGRAIAEGTHRQIVYDLARKSGADWVYCFDGDDYAEWESIDFKANCYFLRNFDFYITREDVDTPYLERKWMGPEFRDVPVLFRVHPELKFLHRIPRGHGAPVFGGFNRHYGKATTVEAFDQACKYYIHHRWKGKHPDLQKRWINRIGKAIHDKSDFGRELIMWDDRKDKTKIVELKW